MQKNDEEITIVFITFERCSGYPPKGTYINFHPSKFNFHQSVSLRENKRESRMCREAEI